jgi:hypothetical protein
MKGTVIFRFMDACVIVPRADIRRVDTELVTRVDNGWTDIVITVAHLATPLLLVRVIYETPQTAEQHADVVNEMVSDLTNPSLSWTRYGAWMDPDDTDRNGDVATERQVPALLTWTVTETSWVRTVGEHP